MNSSLYFVGLFRIVLHIFIVHKCVNFCQDKTCRNAYGCRLSVRLWWLIVTEGAGFAYGFHVCFAICVETNLPSRLALRQEARGDGVNCDDTGLFLCLRLGPVDEKQALGGAREGRVQPVDVVRSEHVVGHVALVYVHVRPLSALRLVAGHGVGVLYL